MESRVPGNEEVDQRIGRVRVTVRLIDEQGKFVEGATSYQATIPATRITTVIDLIKQKVLPKVMK